jgi:hypothetical protein
MACKDEFFANSPLDVRQNYEHTLHLLFNCLAFLRIGDFEIIFSSPSVCLIIARVSVGFYRDFHII